MTARLYVPVRELPDSLRAALSSVGYGRADIEVEARDSVSPRVGGGEGKRGFVLIVDLATGRTEEKLGSWGGSNMFNPANAVDLDGNDYAIPEGVAVIKGTQGHPRVFAALYLSPVNVAKMLPGPAETTERERYLLDCYAGLTSAGRKEHWARRRGTAPTEAELDALVARGFVTRNRAGADAITTAGRNARGGKQVL